MDVVVHSVFKELKKQEHRKSMNQETIKYYKYFNDPQRQTKNPTITHLHGSDHSALNPLFLSKFSPHSCFVFPHVNGYFYKAAGEIKWSFSSFSTWWEAQSDNRRVLQPFECKPRVVLSVTWKPSLHSDPLGATVWNSLSLVLLFPWHVSCTCVS